MMIEVAASSLFTVDLASGKIERTVPNQSILASSACLLAMRSVELQRTLTAGEAFPFKFLAPAGI